MEHAYSRVIFGAALLMALVCVLAITIRHALVLFLSLAMAGPLGLIVAGLSAGLHLMILISIAFLSAAFVSMAAWLLLSAMRSAPRQRGAHSAVFAASAAAASLLFVVPIVGFYLYILGIAVCALRVLPSVDGVRTGPRILAVTLPTLVLVVLGFSVGGDTGIYRSISSVASIAFSLPNENEIRAGILVERLNKYARVEGHYPQHPVAMIPAPHFFPPLIVCAAGSGTTPQDIPLLDGTFADFLSATSNTQALMAADAAGAVPPNTQSIRFGDYVFTALGIDAVVCPPGLWLFVLLPDADNGTPQNPELSVLVGTSVGNVLPMTLTQMQSELAAQNALRQSAGLAPIPDPASVGYDR